MKTQTDEDALARLKTKPEINKIVTEAMPHCGVNDSCPEGRYRVWLENPERVIKAQTKKELRAKLKANL